jgi:ribonuclease PH
MLQTSLEAAVDVDKFPKAVVDVYVMVLQVCGQLHFSVLSCYCISVFHPHRLCSLISATLFHTLRQVPFYWAGIAVHVFA